MLVSKLQCYRTMIQQQSYLILGLARSGKATAAFFDAHHYPYVLYDDSQTDYNGKTVINHPDNISWDTIKSVIQSPGICFNYPDPHPVTARAREKNIPIETDIDLFNQHRDPAAQCIGITGTNGKSTTTALVTHILTHARKHAAMGGNIGVAALSLLMPNQQKNHGKPYNIYVLELSSFQLEATHHIDLDVAAIINITEDHLDRHGTMDHYRAAKHRIFTNATHTITGDTCPKIVTDPHLFDRLPGQHNLENINIAIAICSALDIPMDLIMKGIASFPGLPHRMEIVYNKDNLLIINDSKATNADATEKALACYKDDIVFWIAGGKPKTDGIVPLKPYFPFIARAYFMGEAKDIFLATAKDSVICHTSGTLDGALTKAIVDAQKSQLDYPDKRHIILFSPACASFDQFRDFEHRGDVFRKLVVQR